MSDVTMRKCDMTGEVGYPEDIERVEFGLDGATFEIDLDAEHAGSLRFTLRKFTDAARRTGGRARVRQRNVDGTVRAPAPVGTNGKRPKLEEPTERAVLTMPTPLFSQDGQPTGELTPGKADKSREPGTEERKAKIAAMRTWASRVGYQVGKTARFPSEVEAHYDRVDGKTSRVKAEGKYAADTEKAERELAKVGNG